MLLKVCEPSITNKELEGVIRAVKSGMVSSTGGLVEEFEEEFAKKIGVKHCISTNSGGSALFLALWALGVREGDEVILPTFTMVATAYAVLQCGATPVYVDSEPDTGNIDVTKIEEKITPKTKVIIPVHLYGHPCDMDEITRIANLHGLKVVEDAAEAHGAEYKGKKVGSLGVAGCFSFYANKIITTGEGGAITTDDPKLAEELRAIRQYDMGVHPHFHHTKMAWNMRMSSLEAGLGLGQLKRWDELLLKRIGNAKIYKEELEGVGDIELPIEKSYAKNVYWMFLIKTKFRDELMKFLEKNGIETRTGFHPMHEQPFLEYGEYPVAEELGKTTMYLPSTSDLPIPLIKMVCNKIKEFYANNTR